MSLLVGRSNKLRQKKYQEVKNLAVGSNACGSKWWIDPPPPQKCKKHFGAEMSQEFRMWMLLLLMLVAVAVAVGRAGVVVVVVVVVIGCWLLVVGSSPPRHQAPVCNTKKKKAYCTYFTHFTYVPQPGVGWGGGGVGCNVMHCHAHNCTCAHVGCYAIHLRTCSVLRNCTCAHVRCYAIALAHMLDATHLHLRTCWMLRTCTCAHVRCYAIALAHMFDATQLHLRTSHPLDPAPNIFQ